MINVIVEWLTIRAHNKVEFFDVYKALKLPVVYEDLVAIIVLDIEAAVSQVNIKDLLAKVLLNQRLVDDLESREI